MSVLLTGAGTTGEGGGAPAFLPSSLSGLLIWLKGDGTLWQDSGRTTPVSADANPIGSWDDASGSSNHVLQATAARRPLFKTGIVNSKPVVRFDGVDDYLRAVYVNSQPTTLFIVSRIAIAPSFNQALTDGVTVDTLEIRINGLDNSKLDVYAGNFLTQALPASATVWTLNEVVWNGASSQVWQNAASVASGNAGTSAPGGITLGDYGALSRALSCDIAEVVQYNTALSDTNRGKVETYLNTKYLIY